MLPTTSACDDARLDRVIMRRRPRDAIVCSIVCGLILLLLFAQPQSAAAGNVVSPQNRILKEKYAALRDATLAAAERSSWPEHGARASLSRGLKRSRNLSLGFDTVHPRRFAKDGPLQVAAFLGANADAVDLVSSLRRLVFEPFLRGLLALLDDDTRREISAGVHWPAIDSLHIVVTVFSEHPSLLDDTQREQWRPISDAQVAALGERLSSEVFGSATSAPHAPSLALDGTYLTPDGSMIATFIEACDAEAACDAADAGALGALRLRLSEVGTRSLGPLNSRPKALIHLTIGRLLVWPYEKLNDESRRRVGEYVAKWTMSLAKGQVPAGTASTADYPYGQLPHAVPGVADAAGGRQARRLVVRELELCRDVRWMMGERQTIRTFKLA